MSKLLSDVKVLDLSRILAGPWATQLLADLGAEVIKIEHPRAGDDTRHWGPPNLPMASKKSIESGYFVCANRGKQSLALDISTTEGQAIIHQLLAESDVLVENFKVNGLKKYGLDYSSLKSRYPKLVYCSITGFGQTGPYAQQPGYDAIIQAMGGLMSITGAPEGETDSGPQKVGVAVADLMTGMYASSAILAALHYQRLYGVGQHIDLALLDTQVAWLANQNLNYFLTGTSPSRQGTAHPNIVPYQSFKTADGYIMVAVGNDAQFARFCRVLEQPNWAENERFQSNRGRVENRDELVALITLQMLKKTSDDWLNLFRDEQVPCAPINNLSQVFSDPQVCAREMRRTIVDNYGRQVPTVANPIRFSVTPVEYKAAPPVLGESTKQILMKLGKSETELADWLARGIISISDP
ncbi:CaiB/BaiF CoA transferase family protein [Pleionea litopenaei]|uniref:CaiB/BaiF CoA-transferase family protein n=1 Tax=Pleionea litopenaei TaxID=3070815 RepID=A0AA51X7Q9_9GAMM|nr:CaiB/BaiF CoA-transferase family protein [Pleionea sp. HL-JVS1]WMS87370.1 CaiB/BaiF CoA-transferase family protein [Pleionea sp. HL-JVS1]